MYCHLHLHLEPAERASSTQKGRGWMDKNTFFRAHSLATRRHQVTPQHLAQYIRDLHREQRAEGVDYVELRLSPRRMLADGFTWNDFLSITHGVLVTTEKPVVRAIMLLNRDSPDRFLKSCSEV